MNEGAGSGANYARQISLLAAVACTLILASCGGGGGGSTSNPPPPPAEVLIYPGSPSVPVGRSVQFTAFLPSQPNATFTWAISSGSSNGTINNGGLFAALVNAPCPTSVTVTVTSQTTPAFSGTVTINVSCAQGLVVDAGVGGPSALAMAAGTFVRFFASGNPPLPPVVWLVNGILGGDTLDGTIDSIGDYIAPLTPPPTGSVTITAAAGGLVGTASVTIYYSNRSVSGLYAFSYTGNDGSGFFSAAGSFSADGAGNILNGVQDSVSLTTGAAVKVTFTGTFLVTPDGRGSATLTAGGAWRFTLTQNAAAQAGLPAQHALLIRFGTGASDNATGSGTLDQQSAAAFSASAFFQNYVFGISGADKHKYAIEMAGRFFADGIATIPANSAEQDINYNGSNTSGAADTTLQGTFAMDATYGASNGRGVVTFKSASTIFGATVSSTSPEILQFAFYIVDGTHLKVVETSDGAGFASAGDFYASPNTDGGFTVANTFPAGNYAFTFGGSASNGAFAGGGVFISNGNSSILGGELDTNNGGAQVQLQTSISGSYTVDVNLGRVSLLLTTLPQGQGASYNFSAYTASNGSAELIEVEPALGQSAQSAGLSYRQNSTGGFQGDYAVNISGIANAGNGNLEQDVAGQVATADGLTFAGALDVNNFPGNALAPGEVLTTDSAIVSPDAFGRCTLTLVTSGFNFPLACYVIDNNTALLFGTNSARIVDGALVRQF